MKSNALPKSLVDNPRLGMWLDFSRAGRVRVRSGKVEIGQDIVTALAQIVAEELGVDVRRIDMLPVDTEGSPNEMYTAGSLSVEHSGSSLRFASAQARTCFLAAAALKLDAAEQRIDCRDGAIILDDRKSCESFWTLAGAVDWDQTVDGRAASKSVENYDMAGRQVVRQGFIARCVHGGFIHDFEIAGMMHARVVRQPFRLAKLVDVDQDALLRRFPDVRIVRRADFLAFVGKNECDVHFAQRDAERYVRWEGDDGRWAPPETAGKEIIRSAEQRFAGRTVEATYSRQSIAHASIGPSCALAVHDGAKLTIWSHSQGVFPLRTAVARVLGIETDTVGIVHVPGSGCYGHNGADDAALDAAIIATEMRGSPIRVQWSRQDELSRGPVGAAMQTSIVAALSGDGTIANWRVEVESAPHAQRPGTGGYANLTSAEALDPGFIPRKAVDLPEAAGGGASRNAVAIYDLPAQEVSVTLDASSKVRTSSLRSLGAHLNVYAIECVMDELAALADMDPLAFRLEHLSDPRGRAVLDGAAEMSGWTWPRASGEGMAMGLGFARYKNRGAWLAAVAEVSVEEEVRVERMFLCVDAGFVINPAGARNQITGGAIQAASWTLKEALPIDGDRIPELDWDSYPILRFSEVPAIEVRFIEGVSREPLGTGEAAQGPVAAAIGNAASRALGLRLRDLPLSQARLAKMLLEL